MADDTHQNDAAGADQAQDPGVNPFLDPRLRNRIRTAVQDATYAYFKEVLNAIPSQEILDAADYATAFGAYVLNQNPYASIANLNKPTIPDSPDVETPWIRKSGVLRSNTAFTPLGKFDAIPAGEVVPFTFEDWEYLRETGSDTDPGTPAQPPVPPNLPPDHTEIYTHRVVKFVRFRYTVTKRRSDTDKQIAYLLVAFSGGDH